MTDPTTRLEAALARLGETCAPDADWEARVLAALEHDADGAGPGPEPASLPPVRLLGSGSQRLAPRSAHAEHTPLRAPRVGPAAELPPPRPRCRGSVVDAVSVLAVAATVALTLGGRPRQVPSVELALTWSAEGPAFRAGAARTGDLVHAIATGTGRHRAVWVYHNDRALIAVCPGAPAACPAGDTALDLRLPASGSYTFVGLTAGSPLPGPHRSFDLDVAAAERAGAAIRSAGSPPSSQVRRCYTATAARTRSASQV